MDGWMCSHLCHVVLMFPQAVTLKNYLFIALIFVCFQLEHTDDGCCQCVSGSITLALHTHLFLSLGALKV